MQSRHHIWWWSLFFRVKVTGKLRKCLLRLIICGTAGAFPGVMVKVAGVWATMIASVTYQTSSEEHREYQT